MRTIPFYVQTLQRSVQFMRGVGPHSFKALERLGIQTLWGLLCHLPSSCAVRNRLGALDDHLAGEKVTLVATAQAYHKAVPRRRVPYRIECQDSAGRGLELIFFNAYPALMQQMPLGVPRVVSGDLEIFMGQARMIHPDHMGGLETLETWCGVHPHYPLTYGLTQKHLRSIILGAISQVPDIPEWLPESVRKQEALPSCSDALCSLHLDTSIDVLNPQNPNRRRLAYDELLAYALGLQLIRVREKRQAGYQVQTQTIPEKILATLPFDLTRDQHQAVAQIFAELRSGERMIRLLQGDVGSGKTAVAYVALALLALEGKQGAMMAPTEILARQHADTLRPWVEALGLKLVVLTGQDKGKKKTKLMDDISKGAADIVVGTHALFQESVLFHNLGLVIIDEQHRFGVEQRLKLLDKGEHAHFLSMTATPIPRTLLLTLHGDLEVSVLKQKPAHRKPVATSVISSKRRDALIQGLPRALKQGHKIFWVCPLVEESGALNLTSVEERFQELQQLLGDKVGLIHGKMKGDDKERIINDFKSSNLQMLVTTTVIEVGVDIPDATLMIIEHAERYGLAQLHQLRGRVGRGDKSSTCILIYSYPISDIGRQRLETIRNSEDGFELAEADLRLRGGGEIAGYKQSGVPDFHFADLSCHQDILRTVSLDAKKIIQHDPDLNLSENKGLHDLLRLFGHHHSLDLLASG